MWYLANNPQSISCHKVEGGDGRVRMVLGFIYPAPLKLTAKMPGKCWFQDRWLKDSAYQEWVLKDKLDKHIARCAAFEIRLICLCCLLLRWSLLNLTWVLVSPYKVLIILALVQVPGNVTFERTNERTNERKVY